MMESIINTLPKDQKVKSAFPNREKNEAKLHIYDARSKMTAVSHKFVGSGYENVSDYKYVWIYFCGIESIHKMRDSYNSLINICNDIKSVTSSKWY